MTRVSVVMSVYNGEAYLQEAIDSILQQWFSDFEFIIINDASTDPSAEIVQSYSDSRIQYLENEQNIGLARSLNRGLAIARGEYVARMDADDISLPDRLVKQVDFLDTHPEVGVLGSGVQVIDSAGEIRQTWQFPTEHGFLKWSLCFSYNPIVHPTVMMRRELVNRVGGYEEDMMTSQDYDLWRRLSSLTLLANLRDVLLLLRKHEMNVSSLHSIEQQNNGLQISQLMISEVLGESVPTEKVLCLQSPERKTSSDARQAAELVYRLYQASLADSALSTVERRMIRRDAANRLLALFDQRKLDVRTWQVLVRAYTLDPSLVARAVVWPIHRIVSIFVGQQFPFHFASSAHRVETHGEENRLRLG